MPLDLDLGPLERAIARLEEGLERYQRDVSDAQIRDGLIQRFEFTYEISHKTLKRFLVASGPSPEVYDTIAFPDLIRTASAQALLLGDWSTWRTYREMRAKTSHTYDEETALAVVAGLPGFLDEARALRDRLQGRLG